MTLSVGSQVQDIAQEIHLSCQKQSKPICCYVLTSDLVYLISRTTAQVTTTYSRPYKVKNLCSKFKLAFFFGVYFKEAVHLILYESSHFWTLDWLDCLPEITESEIIIY